MIAHFAGLDENAQQKVLEEGKPMLEWMPARRVRARKHASVRLPCTRRKLRLAQQRRVIPWSCAGLRSTSVQYVLKQIRSRRALRTMQYLFKQMSFVNSFFEVVLARLQLQPLHQGLA